MEVTVRGRDGVGGRCRDRLNRKKFTFRLVQERTELFRDTYRVQDSTLPF